MSPPTEAERLATLEAGYLELSRDTHDIKVELHDIRVDLSQRPTREYARSMARAWTIAGVAMTAAFSAITALSLAAIGLT